MVDHALLAFEICALQHKPGLKGKDREVSWRNVISLVLQVTGIWGYLRDVLEWTPFLELYSPMCLPPPPPYLYIPGVWYEVPWVTWMAGLTTDMALEGPPWLPDCCIWVPPAQEFSILRSQESHIELIPCQVLGNWMLILQALVLLKLGYLLINNTLSFTNDRKYYCPPFIMLSFQVANFKVGKCFRWLTEAFAY